MNIRHLRALVAIVRSGRVTEAARQVNLSQPAVTQGIAKLEAKLGLSLFERVPGGMVATPAALVLAARAEAALRLIASSRVTSTQIRAFLALARAGSYAGAAVRSGLSEASLHRAVADLSVGLGYRLMERRGRGIALTGRGQAISRNFRLAEAELQSAIAELAALQGREVGRISIGAMPLSRARLLPNAVAVFNRNHPEVEIGIAEGSHVDLIGPLRDGDLDLIIGALRDRSPGEDVVQNPLFVDRPVVVARFGHPLIAAGRAPTPADLDRYGWVMAGEGTPLRSQWRQMFQAIGRTPPHVAIECGSVMMVRQLLVQSDYLTLLSPDQVAVELEARWLVKVCDAPGDISRTIGFTVRSGWRPTALQDRFVSALLDESAKIRAGPQD